jgi:hypothetical protein
VVAHEIEDHTGHMFIGEREAEAPPGIDLDQPREGLLGVVLVGGGDRAVAVCGGGGDQEQGVAPLPLPAVRPQGLGQGEGAVADVAADDGQRRRVAARQLLDPTGGGVLAGELVPADPEFLVLGALQPQGEFGDVGGQLDEGIRLADLELRRPRVPLGPILAQGIEGRDQALPGLAAGGRHEERDFLMARRDGFDLGFGGRAQQVEAAQRQVGGDRQGAGQGRVQNQAEAVFRHCSSVIHR